MLCCAYPFQDEKGNKRANEKSNDTSEWFQTEEDIVEQAFNETLDELGIDNDNVVRTFYSKCIVFCRCCYFGSQVEAN